MMDVKYFIVILGVIKGVCIALADFPPPCMRMVEMNLFLHDCCQYPVIERRPEIYDTCLKACNEFDYCCFQECSAKESGTFNEKNNTMLSDKLKTIFAMQLEDGKFENMTEEWVKVLSESVDSCNAPRSPDMRVCEFIYEQMSCIFKENFINCPIMSVKDECKAVKTEMEECGHEEGSWRFITDAFNKMKMNYARRYAKSHL